MASRFLCCLVLVLCTASIAAASVFVSIDCGSSTPYQDANLIQWTGDDNYTNNGESRSVPSSNSISHVLDTLRVFTTRKKNCYKIDSVNQTRVLLRARFYYGNYDGKDLPPTFDLHYDGNYWTSVETSSTVPIYYEVIYVTKNDYISVCVAQTTKGQFPFISAIEVRVLETFMYDKLNDGVPLLKLVRFAYGVNATIRYPNDPYDRIWAPMPADNGFINIHKNSSYDILATSSFRAPPAVLNNAITPITQNSSIPLFTSPLEFPAFMTWYFSEVIQLPSNETRMFRFYKDNVPYSVPFSPYYTNATVFYASPLLPVNTTISLVPLSNSSLPPLINAMEIFLVGDPTTNGTDSGDVAGLKSLQDAFAVLQDWTGEPCLPSPYSWDWIECNNDTTPRVTALLLASFGLTGVLPDFSSMDALQTIDLHNNSLQGPIPSFLGTFPDLTLLNLGSNEFSGTVPSSLSNKPGLNLVVTGNPNLSNSNVSSPTPFPFGNPKSNSTHAPPVNPKHNSSTMNNIGYLPIIILFGTIISIFMST